MTDESTSDTALRACAEAPAKLKKENREILSLDSAKENEPPPCSQCGGPHPFDTSIPSPTWNAVIRAASLPDYLCLPCIVKAFAAAHESFTATLWGGQFDGDEIEVTIGGALIQDVELLSLENNELRVKLHQLRAEAPATDKGLEALLGGTCPHTEFGARTVTICRACLVEALAPSTDTKVEG
jgi:hypothetical protein